MKCSNCGTKNPKKYKHCKECGEELVAPVKAKASPQPAVVIIQEERRRRGVPGLIWILVGMILVVLLCGLLVWLDFVDIPEAIRVRLPGPIGDIVDAVDDARLPGAPVVNLPGGVEPPGNQGQQPPQIQPGPSSDACNEDLNDKLIVLGHQFDVPVPFSRQVIGRFRAWDPLASASYDLYVEQYGETVGPIPCGTRPIGDDKYEIYTQETFRFDADAWVTLSYKPSGENCVVGEQELMLTCQSGSFWHDNWSSGNGCCTHGCWCDDGSGNMGCWQDCAPACAE